MDDGPPPFSAEGETLSPPPKKRSGVVEIGALNGILSPKEPNTIASQTNAERRSESPAAFQPASAKPKQPQQPHRSKTSASILSADPSTDGAVPIAVTATANKPSPLLIQPQPSTNSVSQIVSRNSNNYNNNQNKQYDAFAVPTAPPLRFTSSIFSNTPMPLPDLVDSKTFGPNGFLQPPPAALHATSSMGHPLIRETLFATPLPFSNIMSGDDLAMAANALLDLTPAMAMSSKKRLPDSTINNNSNNDLERKPSAKRGKPATTTASSNGMSSRQEQVVSRARALLEGTPTRTIIACKCKNSQCLKLYCQCFQTGTVCDELICVCKGCKNTANETKPRGARTIAIHDILNRRPDAFEPRLKKKTGKGCACKKSQCLLKYCDCFANGNPCSDQCGCESCLNGKPDPPRDGSSSNDHCARSLVKIASSKTAV